MTTTLDYEKIKEEIVVYLRNSNIYTTTVRSVTTVTDTGTFSTPTASLTINRSNVKNIRSITVATVPLSFGIDYTVNYDSSGTCVITFTTSQSGAYSVTYDYGTDKIFADLPRTDLAISSFPRIGVDIIGDNQRDIGLGGGTKFVDFSFAIYVYDFKAKDIDNTLAAIKTAMLTKQKTFYYQKYVVRLTTGPLLVYQTYGNTKVMLKSIDYLSKWNIEYV